MSDVIQVAKKITIGYLAVIGFFTLVAANVIVTNKLNVKIWKEEL